MDLNKSKKITCSNWAKRPLEQKQIRYAAIDAIILNKIYDKIVDPANEKTLTERLFKNGFLFNKKGRMKAHYSCKPIDKMHGFERHMAFEMLDVYEF